MSQNENKNIQYNEFKIKK